MTGQPDFFVPVRDPALPAGDSVGQDTESGFRIGWSYEPVTESSASQVSALFAPSAGTAGFNADIAYYNGRLFVAFSTSVNTYLTEITTSGATVRTMDAVTLGIPGSGGGAVLSSTSIAADASGIVLLVRYRTGPSTRFETWRVPLSMEAGSATRLTVFGTTFLGEIAIADGELWSVSGRRVSRRSFSTGAVLGTVTLSADGTAGGLTVTDRYIAVGSAVFSRVGQLTTDIGSVTVSGRAIAFDGGAIFYSVLNRTELGITQLAGLPLQAFSLRRSTNGGSSWQYYNAATSTWQSTEAPQPSSSLTDEGIVREPGVRHYSLFLGANWNSGTGTHLFQARNRDQRSVWSPWSASLTVLPGTATSVNIITPDMDNADLDAGFNPRWTVGTPQAYYRVTTRSVGRLLQRTGVVTSSGTSHIWGSSGIDQILTDLPNEPDEGSILNIEVEVWSSGFLKSTGRRSATVRYLPPIHAFNVNALEEPDHAAVLLTWITPAQRGSNPPTTRVEIHRRVEGENPLRIYNEPANLRMVSDAPVDTDAAFTDYWAPLERLLEYSVRTFGARGQVDPREEWFE